MVECNCMHKYSTVKGPITQNKYCTQTKESSRTKSKTRKKTKKSYYIWMHELSELTGTDLH